MSERSQKNVFGEPLEACCFDPMTGFLRSGYCDADVRDLGLHIVCTVMTDEFLQYSKEKGNDLMTPRTEFNFSGLKVGDSWCLCATRWLEAHKDKKAPRVKLRSTHLEALEIIDLKILKPYAVDLS